MSILWPRVKDPDEVLDYSVDWSDELGSDTILTSTWSITSGAGLVINSNTTNGKATSVWLSGGTDGVTYELLNRVTTVGLRTLEQTGRLRCKSK